MRRRKGSKYRWFPTAGTTVTVGESTYSYSWYGPAIITPQPSQANPPALGTDIGYFPLVRDETVSEEFATQQGYSLRDTVEGQDWLLKRLVGSVFVACGAVGTPTSAAGDYWCNVKVTCGIAVARAQQSNPEAIDLNPVDYDPENIDNSADSWVWRRAWMLSKPVQAGEGTPGTFDFVFPITNVNYGSMREGTHIDSKVARRITRELRLWFIYKVSGWSGPLADTADNVSNQPPVAVLADIRVLGAMRRGRNTKQL